MTVSNSTREEINRHIQEWLSVTGQAPIGEICDIVPLSGGLSNHCFVVNHKWVYRKHVETPGDKEQTISYILSKRGLAPRPLYRWPDASLEEYVHADSFNHRDFCAQIPEIFQIIRGLHSIHVGDVYSQHEYMVTPTPNVIIDQIQSWLGGEQPLINRLPVRARSFYARLKTLIDPPTRRELLRFRQCICHNDLHPGNILQNHKLVDFELSGMNYELYDWANLANELEMSIGRDGNYVLTPNPLIEPLMVLYLKVDATDLQFFRDWSHFFWGLWGMVKCQQNIPNDPSNFDYGKYSSFRFSLIENRFTK